AFGRYRPPSDPGVGGVPASFDISDVGALVDEHLLPRRRLGHHGQLVPHRAGRHEDGCLLADDLGGFFFQGVDGGIVGVDIVSYLGLGHGSPHLRRGSCDGVGAEVRGPVGERHAVSLSTVDSWLSRLRADRGLDAWNASPARFGAGSRPGRSGGNLRRQGRTPPRAKRPPWPAPGDGTRNPTSSCRRKAPARGPRRTWSPWEPRPSIPSGRNRP